MPARREGIHGWAGQEGPGDGDGDGDGLRGVLRRGDSVTLGDCVKWCYRVYVAARCDDMLEDKIDRSIDQSMPM